MNLVNWHRNAMKLGKLVIVTLTMMLSVTGDGFGVNNASANELAKRRAIGIEYSAGENGIVITAVVPGSAAERAGIEAGEI